VAVCLRGCDPDRCRCQCGPPTEPIFLMPI
jgi:hypothetical protein